FIGLYNYDSGIDAARKICAANRERPEAIVCANDEMAIAVCEVLRKQGIRVPEDIAVSGFDNIEDAKTYAPRITSVERPMDEMGYVACDKLIERIREVQDGLASKPPQKYLLETKSIFNESCGCEQPDTLSYEDFRRNYFYQKYHTYTHSKKLKQMSENMILCETLKEYAHFFKDYTSLLEAKSIYLCVNATEFVVSNQNEAVENLLLKKNIRTQGYHDHMKVLFAAQNHKLVNIKDFPLNQIFPDIKREEATVFEISPIHFQDRAIGYLITEDSIFVENRELYYSWIQALSSTYQSVWSKEQLNTVIKSLSDLYIRDSLTGLYNRFGYEKLGMEIYQQVRCQRQSLMILFADVDGLKKVNDLYGHEQGDFSIRSIAGILHMLCPGNGITVRYGGDEFMMIIPGYDEDQAMELTKVIETELLRFSKQQKLDFLLELSCGTYILEATDGKTSLEECMKIADTRMYEIKKKKKADRKAE
ncbi:MAG: diguanylate cyclase, partial [Clostridia bacterium]|nr:diguanylate cyclase [Clostridia bacterium]